MLTHTQTLSHTLQLIQSYDLCIGLVVLFGMVVFLKSFAFGFQFWLFHNILNQLKKKKERKEIPEATFSQLSPNVKEKPGPQPKRQEDVKTGNTLPNQPVTPAHPAPHPAPPSLLTHHIIRRKQ